MEQMRDLGVSVKIILISILNKCGMGDLQSWLEKGIVESFCFDSYEPSSSFSTVTFWSVE
jgi:hypothetical protein